jgi:hypothetical protein
VACSANTSKKIREGDRRAMSSSFLARLFSCVPTMNASAMHDGMSVVHACEWPALVTVPLDLPPSLDAVLFNVTCSSLLSSLIVSPTIFPRPPLVSKAACFSSTLFMSGACLEGYLLIQFSSWASTFLPPAFIFDIFSVCVSVNFQPSTISAV